jgi:dihydroorotase
MELTLSNVRLHSPGSPLHGSRKDLVIVDGRIAEIVEPGTSRRGEVWAGDDWHVSPGWFDLHVHFREPGEEQKETIQTGLNAAQQGGFTRVLLMPSTSPPIDNQAAVAFALQRASGHLVALEVAGCLSVGRQGKDLAELYDLHKAGTKAFTDDLRAVSDTGLMTRALDYVRNFGGRIMAYPEDPFLGSLGQVHEGVPATLAGMKGMPGIAEAVMIARDLQLVEYTGTPLHFSTVSSRTGVALLRAAKQRGLPVTADVAAYSLLNNDSVLERFDSHYKVKPPLRGEDDRLALIEGLKDGTLDAITSHHRPEDIEHKQLEFSLSAYGMIGLESAFAVARTAVGQHLSIDRLVEAFCIGPRRALGLPIPKLEPGTEAELTVFSPDTRWTLQEEHLKSRSRNTPYIGHSFSGKPVAVVRGKQFARIPSAV